jgi:hypothetical protein
MVAAADDNRDDPSTQEGGIMITKYGMTKGLTMVEDLIYTMVCVLTLAGLYVTKLVIKKAVYEAMLTMEAHRDAS